jgi:hypothetical protein
VNTDSRNSRQHVTYYPHHEVGWPSPKCVHDVAGKSGIHYPHDEGA